MPLSDTTPYVGAALDVLQLQHDDKETRVKSLETDNANLKDRVAALELRLGIAPAQELK
jgi:hypothetical protein